MRRAAGLIAVVLILAGCGSGDGSADQAEPVTSTPASSTPTATTPPPSDCGPLSGATTGARRGHGPTETMFLTSVKVEALDCSDRVTFGFRDSSEPPGYRVAYEPASTAKVEDASGRRIEVAGSAFLVVRLTPAMTAEISGEKVEPTYSGPRRITPEGTQHVQEVVKTGDFEAQVTWVIGLDEERPYTVAASNSRLVLEIG